jgi:hypothetical protein
MNIVAAMAVNGRHPLLKHTIGRLIKKGIKVVCVGEHSDEEVCVSSGAQFKYHFNHPLGDKWNQAFRMSKDLNPDAVLFVGSSDWVSDNWVDVMLPYLDKYDMVGKAGCHLLDVSKKHKYRLVYWPGYKTGCSIQDRESRKQRANESIGIGRLISKRGLDKIGWEPFDYKQHNSLDWTMYNKLKNNTIVTDDSIHSMAISTDRWKNKHTFDAHWNNLYPSTRIKDLTFCKENFPEYDKIF